MSRHITYVSAPSVVALVSAGALLMASAAPTAAADASVLPEPEGDIGDYGEFITSYDENEFISSYDPADFIESLGSAESEEEDVIVLETDILFAAMEWELPGPAGSKIGELVEEVPEGLPSRSTGIRIRIRCRRGTILIIRCFRRTVLRRWPRCWAMSGLILS